MRHAFAGIVLAAGFAACAVEMPVNIALGKPVVGFSHPPNYHLSRDAEDAKQLTDGLYSDSSCMWTDRKRCVGWTNGDKTVRAVTVDLGEDSPICGFSWNFPFGRAGVFFVSEIDVYVSVDGTNWCAVGSLLDRALTLRCMPPPNEYGVYRAHAEDMPCHGRYVMFVVLQLGSCFCDELEVYRGDCALLSRPNPGVTTTDPIAFRNTIRLRNHLLDQANRALAPDGLKDRIAREVDFAEYRDRPTVLPMTSLQRDIWAANAVRMRAAGFDRPVFWANDRWENLDPLAIPTAKDRCTSVSLAMMRGEVRAATVNVMNPTDRELTCDFSVAGTGIPIDCSEVLFTDVRAFRITASALRSGNGNAVRFRIPAGVSKQVWISVRRPRGPAGTRRGTCEARLSDGTVIRCPFCLELADVDYPDRPRLHIGGWDYLDSDGACFRTPGNVKPTLALHRDFGLDMPWASRATLPQGAKFDKDGKLVSKLDFTRWDHWTLDVRPDARLYALSWGVVNSFCEEPAGTARFDRMVGEYLQAWITHARANGLNGRRILLLLVDEPSTKEKQDIIFKWMKPIRAAGIPEFGSFEDPQFAEPWNVPEDFWGLCDVICPIAYELRRDPKVLDFWTGQAARGKEVWLYNAQGPSRTFDPISYYRMQAWTAFRIGSKETGIQFWAFGCGGGIGDSWRAYAQRANEYSPYFVSPTDVMNAKQNEAIREGAEDYEYLCMYADRFGRERLKLLLERVFAALPYGDPDWNAPGRDHAFLDRARGRILDALASESGEIDIKGLSLRGF